MSHERIGFVGLGGQGAPMAHQIIAAGFPTFLHARREASLEPFAGSGATTVSTPAELGARSDIVGVCVYDDDDVDEVVAGPRGILEGAGPGTVIAVHSTIRPETCLRLAGLAAEKGVTLIDAPVSGGREAPARKALIVMVGADPDTYARCRPMFAAYSNRTFHLGPVGSALRAKLVNNALSAANFAVLLEALDLGARLGLDTDALLQVLHASSGGSQASGFYLQAGSPAGLVAMGAHAFTKDVDNLYSVAGGRDAVPDVLSTAAERALDLLDIRGEENTP